MNTSHDPTAVFPSPILQLHTLNTWINQSQAAYVFHNRQPLKVSRRFGVIGGKGRAVKQNTEHCQGLKRLLCLTDSDSDVGIACDL